ncbi:S1 RNA-binding domain-containing protein [Sphaerisporangium album]|nr:S1 RNA-binding domain-containing protein [Sphaerisporangium album]
MTRPRAISLPLRERLAEPMAGEDDPDVLVLASLLCTPPLVPYGLLRRMRRTVVTPSAGTLGVEGALCSAWFVEGVAPEGFAFEAEFADALRSRLRAALAVDHLEADRDGLRRVIDEETARLSPLLRLEERLCWAYVAESAFESTADKIFTDIVYTVALEEGRRRILHWAVGAFTRLPPDVIKGPAAWVLAQLCGAAGLPHPRLEWPDTGVDETLLRTALALVPDTLLGVHRDGETLTIGTITQRRRTALRVSAVTPKVLTVRSDEGSTRLVIDPSIGAVEVPVGRSAVEIRDMRGRTYRLAPFTGDAAPEEVLMRESLARLDQSWRAREVMDATIVRVVGRGDSLIVSFVDFPWCTALLPASRSGLPSFRRRSLSTVGDPRIRVRVINLDARLQRVVVERVVEPAAEEQVEAPWSSGSLRVGDEFRGRVTGKVAFGLFVSYAAAAGVEEGKRTNGLVHRSELSWTEQWNDATEYPVEVGDMITVHVMGISAARQRVQLSLKRTQPDPWQVAMSRLRPGDQVRALVVEVVSFGWFLRLPSGFDGLMHITEAPEGSTFAVGTELDVWVRFMDAERRRISLTLRPPPWPPGDPSRR